MFGRVTAVTGGSFNRKRWLMPDELDEFGSDLEGSNSDRKLGFSGELFATTDYDPINACILLLHCVHSSDRRREVDQF
jgi:hypothetical protein